MAKIYISAGHGGNDPGAVNGVYKEKDYTLLIANHLKSLIETKTTHTVLMARTTDKSKSIDERCAEANVENVDLILDLHLNSFTDKKVSGCEVFHSIYNDSNFASKLSSSISKILGIPNRGAKTKKGSDNKDYYGMIRGTIAECVIIEHCFLSNDDDMKKLLNVGVDKIANTIYNILIERYGGVKKTDDNVKGNEFIKHLTKLYDEEFKKYEVKYNSNNLDWKINFSVMCYLMQLRMLYDKSNYEKIINLIKADYDEYLYIANTYSNISTLAVKTSLAIAQKIQEILK